MVLGVVVSRIEKRNRKEKDKDSYSFGKIINLKRREFGLSIRKFSKKIGCCPTIIADFEQYDLFPSLKTVYKICECLNLSFGSISDKIFKDRIKSYKIRWKKEFFNYKNEGKYKKVFFSAEGDFADEGEGQYPECAEFIKKRKGKLTYQQFGDKLGYKKTYVQSTVGRGRKAPSLPFIFKLAEMCKFDRTYKFDPYTLFILSLQERIRNYNFKYYKWCRKYDVKKDEDNWLDD